MGNLGNILGRVRTEGRVRVNRLLFPNIGCWENGRRQKRKVPRNSLIEIPAEAPYSGVEYTNLLTCYLAGGPSWLVTKVILPFCVFVGSKVKKKSAALFGRWSLVV